ncbi:MAG: flagellar basal body-associated FliL family protein [Alphaproteobacteria bacterium]|nr:flagellar basal body-associated FliL family protein [Alphaproteobacteria bacterium]
MAHDTGRGRIVQFYAVAVLLLLCLLSAGYFFADRALHASAPQEDVGIQSEAQKTFISDMTYVDLPRLTVSFGGGLSNVQLDIALEVARDDIPVLEKYVPQIVDRFNAFFPHVPFENVREARFVFSLRQDLLRQVRSIGMPIPVHDLMLHKLLIL